MQEKNRQVIDVDSIQTINGPPMVDLTQDDDIIVVGTSRLPRVPTGPYSMPATNNLFPGGNTTQYHPHRSTNPSSTKRKRPSLTSYTVGLPGPSRRSRAKTPEIIALDSETSEGEVEKHLTSSPLKKIRQDYYGDDQNYALGSDDDGDDGRFPSPTVEDVRWKPIPAKECSPKVEQIDSILSTPITQKLSERKPSFITRWQDPKLLATAANNNTIGHFGQLRSIYSARNRNTFKGVKSMALSKTTSFKQSPGSIMHIIQKQDWIVICSVCEGDHPDLPEGNGPLSPYNREGSLIAWHQGQADIIPGHRRGVGDDRWKYYSVNDIKFDPTSPGTSFVSSGGDRKIRSWQREAGSHEYVQDAVVNRLHRYSHVPHALAFKPGTRTLAVAEKRVHVYEDYDKSLAHISFNVAPSTKEHSVGEVLWGCDSTDGFIFASSEPDDVDCFEGFHQAIDVNTRKSYKLDSDEAGDSIALMCDGDLLVHASRGLGGKHPLRLYDVRRKDWRAIKKVDMEGFAPNIRGEINSISVSPDGIYIAIGRIDNRAHVYDGRMLAKGTLFDFKHKGNVLASPGRPLCGLVGLQWAETEFSRLTVVSGGMDGCVRLWDPLQAISSPTNGTILAQANSDVAHFTLGDCTSKEQQLVVGDSSGEVYMFNSSQIYIRPL